MCCCFFFFFLNCKCQSPNQIHVIRQYNFFLQQCHSFTVHSYLNQDTYQLKTFPQYENDQQYDQLKHHQKQKLCCLSIHITNIQIKSKNQSVLLEHFQPFRHPRHHVMRIPIRSHQNYLDLKFTDFLQCLQTSDQCSEVEQNTEAFTSQASRKGWNLKLTVTTEAPMPAPSHAFVRSRQ